MLQWLKLEIEVLEEYLGNEFIYKFVCFLLLDAIALLLMLIHVFRESLAVQLRAFLEKEVLCSHGHQEDLVGEEAGACFGSVDAPLRNVNIFDDYFVNDLFAKLDDVPNPQAKCFLISTNTIFITKDVDGSSL